MSQHTKTTYSTCKYIRFSVYNIDRVHSSLRGPWLWFAMNLILKGLYLLNIVLQTICQKESKLYTAK